MIYLGTEVSFLIPECKLSHNIIRADYEWENTRMYIQSFLSNKFGGYTLNNNIFGFWKNCGDIMVEFRVTISKDKLNELINFLQEIRKHIQEEAIYIKIGDQTYLIK
jgi:hypothetical protein